jgi:serpin B
VATALALAGCASSKPEHGLDPTASGPARIVQAGVAREPASAVPATSLSVAVEANNAFAVDLYTRVRADGDAGNLLTSPISAALALTMAYAGAVGPTATEMATALHFGSGADGSIFAGQNALSQALNARGPAALAQAQDNASRSNQAPPSADDYQLAVVNSVWGQDTYTWQPPFLEILAKNYGTGVYQEDFVNAFEPARQTINGWVSQETNAKINDLLPSGALDTDTRMVLVNALHLKLPWATAFLPADTQPASFTRQDGSSVTASFMNLITNFPYADDGNAQIVSLPLSGDELSVVIALPHEGVSLASYEDMLENNAAPLGLPQSSALVQLSLPKASFTSESFSLSKALKSMGMNLAFDGTLADLSGLCAAPPDKLHLYVADVLQKATISMAETGAEAAAATAVIVSGEISIAVTPPVPTPLIVNRPYLVEIVDVPTGAVLMLGHVQDPTNSGGP